MAKVLETVAVVVVLLVLAAVSVALLRSMAGDNQSYEDAIELGTRFLGWATTLAGFLGISKGATQVLFEGPGSKAPLTLVSGFAALFAGNTIMGEGNVAASAAFAALVLSAGLVAVKFGWGD